MTTTGSVDAQKIYERSVVVDGSIAPRVSDEYLERLVGSGVTAVNWTVCRPWGHFVSSMEQIGRGLEVIAGHPKLILALSDADIARAKEEGKIAVIFGPQNALPAEGIQGGFRILHQMGVRILQLTYNERNAYGDGAPEPSDAGLSKAGIAAVEELDRLGIVVDLSHCGDRTTLEAIDKSAHPVLFTHANARAVHDNVRNKTDEQIKALAARGGVIGLTLYSLFLRSDRQPTLEDYVRHFSYVADLVGVEHIGIGTDHSEGAPRGPWEHEFGVNGMYPSVIGEARTWFAYDTRFTAGATSVSDFPAIVDALAGLGLTEDELTGVLGGNFQRVFRTVWGG
jgi:membrane dipeptidase